MLTKFTDLARKLPSPIYKAAAQAYIDYDFPRHIFIETTAACQLNCEFCPREKRNEHMDFELFKQIVQECSQYGARSFSLHLFGETLLYPKILEAISYIKEQNRNHTVLLTTNGVLLNRFIDELLRVKVDKIIWSWRKNNFTDETKQKLRKVGLIRFLLEETPEGEIEKWEGFKKEVKHLHNYGGNIDVNKWGMVNELPKRYPCYHLWLAPAVRWNGEIVECCNIPKTGDSVIAKYGERTLAEVWRGKEIRELRENHKKGIYPGACSNCSSWQAYPDIWFKSKCQSV